jgi:hypothetical protein
LQNEGFHNLQGDKLKEDKIGGTCRTHERAEKYVHTLSRIPEEKRPLGKSRSIGGGG